MRKIFLFQFLMILFLFFSIPAAATCDCTNEAVTGIPQAECEALVEFHMASNGPYWAYKDGWRTTSWIGDWFGVTVEDGHVTRLDLNWNAMSGTLSPRLAELPYLQVLDLGKNLLGGNIPPGLGALHDLQYLDLSKNHIEGNIPPELGNLTGLLELHLSRNRLSGTIPPEIGNLINIPELNLSNNDLEGNIPPEIADLTNLQVLSLIRNELEGSIPPELGGMTSLESLSLQENQLSGSIPPELVNMTSLRVLSLGENQLTGSIPPELGSMTSLESLSLQENQLSGSIPPELGNMTSLEGLSLGENQLTGSIPPELGDMTNLVTLSILENQLSGSIPPELGNLANLKSLSLVRNQLTGSIPPELGNLSQLERLYLQENQLEGPIPPELGNLDKLEYLMLSYNQLEGLVPAELSNMDSLVRVHLGYNRLSGFAPGFGNFQNSWWLSLSYNQFTEIPPEIANLKNLRSLDLSNNLIKGHIPVEIGDLHNLSILNLSNNQISGTIPAEIGNIPYLREFLIQGNQISGPVPPEIMNLNYLNYVDSWGFSYDTNADYNQLYTDDPAVEGFMDAEFPGWKSTQTLPAENIQAEPIDYFLPAEQMEGEESSNASNLVKISWDPIAYQADDGGYQVCVRESAEGECLADVGITPDKAASALLVSGLAPDTEYFFEVKTRTYPHVFNLNEVTSLADEVVAVQTGDIAINVFPLWHLNSGTFTGMAFSNYGIENAGLVLNAWDEGGLKQGVPINPSVFDVPTSQQFARLGTELFGVTPEIPEKVSWVEIASDRLVGSFFTFGSSDLKMLDGAISQSRPSSRLWFTRPLAAGALSEQGESAEIRFSLVNPLDDPVDVTMSLVQEGETVAEEQRIIAGKGMLFASAEEIFTGGPLPADAYLQVDTTAGVGLIGFSRVDFPAVKTTLALNAEEPSSAETLYSAQLASGPGVGGTGMETHIRLVNPMENPREIVFSAIANDGTQLAESVTRTLEGKSVLEEKAWDLFAFDGDSAVGSLVIEVASGGVVGDVIFTPFEGIEYAAAMPLQARPVKEAVFNHIANSDEIYTGLAFFNPGAEDAEITVVATRADGTVSGTRQVTLGPNQRISRTLKDADMLPGTASQLDGFISISSTRPIICQQLYGSTDLRFLAAVPPTTAYGEMF